MLWSLAVLGRPLPALEQLRFLASQAADPDWLESASLHMVVRVSHAQPEGVWSATHRPAHSHKRALCVRCV